MNSVVLKLALLSMLAVLVHPVDKAFAGGGSTVGPGQPHSRVCTSLGGKRVIVRLPATGSTVMVEVFCQFPDGSLLKAASLFFGIYGPVPTAVSAFSKGPASHETAEAFCKRSGGTVETLDVELDRVVRKQFCVPSSQATLLPGEADGGPDAILEAKPDDVDFGGSIELQTLAGGPKKYPRLALALSTAFRKDSRLAAFSNDFVRLLESMDIPAEIDATTGEHSWDLFGLVCAKLDGVTCLFKLASGEIRSTADFTGRYPAGAKAYAELLNRVYSGMTIFADPVAHPESGGEYQQFSTLGCRPRIGSKLVLCALY